MSLYSIDFGGSTVDLIHWDRGRIGGIRSFERSEVRAHRLSDFVDDSGVRFVEGDELFVTGGRSASFGNSFEGIPVSRVNEIEAIGRGGEWLVHEQMNAEGVERDREGVERGGERDEIDFKRVGDVEEGDVDPHSLLVVSMGTGTCMVSVRSGRYEHVGGTGVGGGTFLSLCGLLLKERNPERLVELFHRGDARNVDLSVGEIVGQGIGRVSAEVTASNLGKMSRSEIDFSQADLAAGILNLVGQTIATAAVFAARAEQLESIVLTGKLTRIAPIVEIVRSVARLYDRRVMVPPRAEFVSAVGAGVASRSV